MYLKSGRYSWLSCQHSVMHCLMNASHDSLLTSGRNGTSSATDVTRWIISKLIFEIIQCVWRKYTILHFWVCSYEIRRRNDHLLESMLNKFTFWRKWIKSNIDRLGQYTPADEYFVFPQGPSWPWISYNIMANEYVSPFWVPWGWVFFDLSSSGAVHNNSGFQNKQSNKQNTKLSSTSWDAPLNEYKLTEVFFFKSCFGK